MEINNILVPVDFSACSKNALKIAIDIAKKANAKIHMVNAVHVHTPHPDLAGGSLIDAIIADYESQVQQSFEELESDLIELQDVPHEADRFISYLTDAINLEVEEKNIDFIIMGTRTDHEGIEHIVGTNTSDIVSNSDVPVLVLPEDISSFNPKKIGFASDFLQVSDESKYEVLKWIANLYDSEILVFHISDDPGKISLEEEKQIRSIQKNLAGIKSSVKTCKSESIEEGVLDFTEDNNLELLALMPRKHNIFHKVFKKSYTKTLVINPIVPILTFRDK